MPEYISHPWINKNTIEKRAYQDNIARTSFNGNTLVVLPTGLGKTNIAAIVAAHCLEKDMNKKILFLAPTKPLVEQHKKTFQRFLKIGEDELVVLTGETKPEDRVKLYNKADIIFSTPQTIENDLDSYRLNLKNFSLLIVDEAHRAVGNYAYPHVAACFVNQSSGLILALTASPGSYHYKIEEVMKKLFITNVEIRTRDDNDVKAYIQKVEYEWEEVLLSDEMKKIKQLLEKIKDEKIKKLMSWRILHSPMVSKSQILAMQQELARRKTGPSYAAMSLLAEVLKIDHALLLLETQCIYSLKKYTDSFADDKTKAVERLIKNEDFTAAMDILNELIKNEIEHPKMERLKDIISAELKENKLAGIIIFAQFRDTIEKIEAVLHDVRNAAPVEFIGQTKKKGKGLSQKEQVQILNEFKLGFYNILIASQVGEEGLDIEETNVVIFYEPVPSAVRLIQRTGRTARTKPGKVIVLMTKDTRDEAYYWSARHKEKKMKKILYDMQGSLGKFSS
ncbi:MAG: DEAD/DEAH box helicase family protein [Candidatus Aenigmatarchaeota archaeon]